jgi:hypothetical protein
MTELSETPNKISHVFFQSDKNDLSFFNPKSIFVFSFNYSIIAFGFSIDGRI